MRSLFRGYVLVAAVAVAAAAAGSASAESRLFSVRTDQPSVTIVQAARNGQPLSVAGQNGGATFFRIDNPAGQVPCANHFQFVASNGASVDAPVDLCANNWALTVAVGATAPAPAAAAPAPMPAPQTTASVAGQPLAIATDDEDVTITDVFLNGQAVPIAGRQDPYVEIMLPPSAQGSQCSRDLGLGLSDGRRIARQVDVCRSNFVVVVSLVGGVPPPAIPPSLRQPARVQPLPPATIQPLPPAPVAAAPVLTPVPPQQAVAGMQWLFSAPGNTATVAYGLPDGSSAFRAVCMPRAGGITITLGGSAPEVRPGGYVPVRLIVGAYSRAYTATGSQRSEIDGLSHPVFQTAASDPLWSALITARTFTVAIGTGAPIPLSLAGSAPPVKQFLALCAGQPILAPIPSGAPQAGLYAPPPTGTLQPLPGSPDAFAQQPPAPPAGIGGNDVSFACDDGSNLSATFRGNTVVVDEPGVPPVVLFLAGATGQGQRYAAGRSQLVGQGEDIYWSREGGPSRTCTPQ